MMNNNRQLICLIKLSVQKGEFVDCIKTINWRRIMNSIIENGLAPFFYSKKEIFHKYFDDFPEQLLKEEYLKTHFRFLKFESALNEINEILIENKIKLSVIKGYSNAKYIYANPAQRPIGDLDILVDKKQALQTYALLTTKLAYQSFETNPNEKLKTNKSFAQLHKNGITIDIHWNLANYEFDTSFFKLEENHEVDNNLLKLNPSIELLFNSLHFLKHIITVKYKLLWLIDILILWERFPEYQKSLENLPRYYNSKSLAKSFLLFLNKEFDLKIKTKKSNSNAIEKILYNDNINKEFLKLRYYFLNKGFLSKLWKTFFPSREILYIIYPNSKKNLFILRLIRIIHVFQKLLKALKLF